MDDRGVEEDWNDVIIECNSLSAKWERLSGYIGLPFSLIDAIKRECGSDIGGCWDKALKEWICQNYNTSRYHKPSWRTLLRAVAQVDRLLFDKLRCKHPIRPSKLESVPTKLHQDESLHEAGLKQDSITSESVDSVLEASIGSEALSYPCTYRFLDVKGMSENKVVELKHRLSEDYKSISTQYSTLKQGVIRSLNERGVTPKQLSIVLMDLNIFPVKKTTNNPLLQDQLEEIREQESIDDAFYILHSYGSFFDCYILKHIVNSLGTESDKAQLKQYEEDLHNYCKRNIFECPHFSMTNSDYSKSQVVLKVDEIVTRMYTLNALRDFRTKLAEILGLEGHALLLHTVEEGCLKITFQVPHLVVGAIVSLTTEQKTELRILGVIKVTCGQYTIALIPQQAEIYSEWLKAWKSWASIRKRGNMAQFILQKLEENKQARWLNITTGKFELTEWHRIAEEWFKKKPRNSDLVDAPRMLRRGLPRAFPGLDEVKGESIKEGTQYRSRVFQAPATFVQEVQLYMSKPMSMVETETVHNYDHKSRSGQHVAAMQMSSDPQTTTDQVPQIKVNDSFISLSELDNCLPDVHSRASISEQDNHLPLLRPTMLMASYSDAADSAVSMSFDNDLEQEMLHQGSASLISSELYSLNSSVSQQLLSITIQAQEGKTFANGLQYECVYQVMEDFPPNRDFSDLVLKSGDRIVQIGNHLVCDKGPEDFAKLLCTEASHGTTVKILPQLSSSSSGTSIHSRKQLVRRQSDRELASSLTTKVTNLLTLKHKASIHPRCVTVPFISGEGWGFKVTGGNAVGIFISKVSSSQKELQIGDQVLELGGQSAVGMSCYEATSILRSSKDKIQLRVAENIAKFTAIKDQFELESYYIRSHVDHTPSDSKDMPLKKGGIVRVVNTVLFPGYWLAWSVDPNTGLDVELRRILSPSKAKQLHGKDVYEAVNIP